MPQANLPSKADSNQPKDYPLITAPLFLSSHAYSIADLQSVLFYHRVTLCLKPPDFNADSTNLKNRPRSLFIDTPFFFFLGHAVSQLTEKTCS